VADAVLIFDGECGFCRRSVRILRARVRRVPRIVAWQSIDPAQYGTTEEACRTAVQHVGTDGRVRGGADGIARLLVEAGWPWLVPGRVMSVPGVIHISRAAYRWVARNRHRFRGDPA
jgi:predicted DCC family thiol-disulfide oxidoreductase YuxK